MSLNNSQLGTEEMSKLTAKCHYIILILVQKKQTNRNRVAWVWIQ